MVKQFGSFDVEGYRRRLKILRKLYDETQAEFARRVGIPYKKWNHYERGYPIPRETAFILHEKLAGISTDWIWFGTEGNLTAGILSRIRKIEREEARALQSIARAQQAAKLISKRDKR